MDIWQIIRDYMTGSRGVGAPSGTLSKAEWDEYYNSEAYDRAEAAHLDVGSGDLEPWMREDESFNKAQDAYDEWLGSGGEPEHSQSWRVLQRAMAEEQEGREAAMQEGVPSDLEDSILSDLAALDQRELTIDHVGIYGKNDPVYIKIEKERSNLIKRLENERKKNTGRLKGDVRTRMGLGSPSAYAKGGTGRFLFRGR